MTQDNQNIDAPENSNLDRQADGGVYDNEINSAHNPLDDNYDPSRIRNNDADDRVNLKFGEKFVKNWQENGIFRATIIVVGFLSAFLLIALLNLLFGSSNAPTQVSGTSKFDAPNTSATEAEVVTPEQYKYIRAQEAILAQEAQKRGESFTPRNLKISNESQDGGQAVLPSTSNVATGVTADQVNSTLFNTNDLNYNGSTGQQQAQGQPQQQQAQGQPQNQFIPVVDYAKPAADQFVQNNNQFAGWYEEQSAKQIDANSTEQEKFYELLEKQIKKLSGEEKKATLPNKSNYSSRTYSVNQQYSVNGDNDQDQVSSSSNSNGKNSDKSKTLVTAGTRMTARLLNDVNTDNGSQVFAEIMTGKLKGRKVLGATKATQDNMQFTLDRILSDGRNPEIPFEGVGQTLQGSFGMATEIDRHIIKNSAAIAASSVAKGYGSAYSQSWQDAEISNSGTVVVNQKDPSNKRIAGTVVGQLGEDFGQKINSIYGNKPTTFRTPVGTVFYIFVNQDIKEQ